MNHDFSTFGIFKISGVDVFCPGNRDKHVQSSLVNADLNTTSIQDWIATDFNPKFRTTKRKNKKWVKVFRTGGRVGKI